MCVYTKYDLLNDIIYGVIYIFFIFKTLYKYIIIIKKLVLQLEYDNIIIILQSYRHYYNDIIRYRILNG